MNDFEFDRRDPVEEERWNVTVRYGIIYPIGFLLITGFFSWLFSF